MMLRESLQLQQPQSQQKEANNNINKSDAIGKQLPATTATSNVKATPLPSLKHDVEPMDIDCQEGEEEQEVEEEEEEEKEKEKEKEEQHVTSSAVVRIKESFIFNTIWFTTLFAQFDLRTNNNQSQLESKSDLTLQRLLGTGQELPARCVDHMYFVLDTNVLMDNLVFVEDLCHVALGETKGSMLYIPYIVIKELDKLKDTRNEDKLKRTKAIRAIHYLNKKFDNRLKIQGTYK